MNHASDFSPSSIQRPVALTLIGIGTGHPGHLTREAIAAMNAADLILLPCKGDDRQALAAVRLMLCREVITREPAPRIVPFTMPERASDDATPTFASGPAPGSAAVVADVSISSPERTAALVPSSTSRYVRHVHDWHAAIARCWQEAIAEVAGGTMAATLDPAMPTAPAGADSSGGNSPLAVALLVWGDPSLYDSTLRIAAQLHPAPVSVRVVPGITAVQALTAAHAITLNEVGQPVLITTGRQLRDQGWPAGVDTVVVMLDGQCSFAHLSPQDAQGLHIWWGAYLGLPQQLTDSGPLSEAAPRIVQARAAARRIHGWVMDIYLLRRVSPVFADGGPQ